MIVTILVIIVVLMLVIIAVLIGLWVFLRYFLKRASMEESPVAKEKITPSYNSLHKPESQDSYLVSKSDGDLIPFNITESERDVLEMFYSKND